MVNNSLEATLLSCALGVLLYLLGVLAFILVRFYVRKFSLLAEQYSFMENSESSQQQWSWDQAIITHTIEWHTCCQPKSKKKKMRFKDFPHFLSGYELPLLGNLVGCK